MSTLNEDFDSWWSLYKYRNHEIKAREYGEEEVVARIPDASGKEWPGEETDVKYFVRLESGVHVGFREPRTPTGRRKKYAEFPIKD